LAAAASQIIFELCDALARQKRAEEGEQRVPVDKPLRREGRSGRQGSREMVEIVREVNRRGSAGCIEQFFDN
jgi:hypothetical protein